MNKPPQILTYRLKTVISLNVKSRIVFHAVFHQIAVKRVVNRISNQFLHFMLYIIQKYLQTQRNNNLTLTKLQRFHFFSIMRASQPET